MLSPPRAVPLALSVRCSWGEEIVLAGAVFVERGERARRPSFVEERPVGARLLGAGAGSSSVLAAESLPAPD